MKNNKEKASAGRNKGAADFSAAEEALKDPVTPEQKIEMTARTILDRYRKAFEELAK